MQVLRNEILAFQAKLGQSELRIRHMEAEKASLRAAEARLMQENEILHRQKNSSAEVLENLKQVRLNQEREEAAVTVRLRNRCEDLEKELGLLRKKLDQDQEQFRESVKAWEASSQELREKLEAAQKAEKGRQEELEEANKKLEAAKQELGEVQEKLELAESTLSTK